MAYVKRDKLTIINCGKMKDELVEVLIKKFPNRRVSDIKNLILYPIPMTALRWTKYLSYDEIDKYLCPLGEENALGEYYKNSLYKDEVKVEIENFDDIGI